MTKSIIQEEKECFICYALYRNGGRLPVQYTRPLHRHHIMHGTANRKIAEKYGLWVWLCPYHHTIASEAIHNSDRSDKALIRIGQLAFEQKYSHEEWMKLFRKNFVGN